MWTKTFHEANDILGVCHINYLVILGLSMFSFVYDNADVTQSKGLLLYLTETLSFQFISKRNHDTLSLALRAMVNMKMVNCKEISSMGSIFTHMLSVNKICLRSTYNEGFTVINGILSSILQYIRNVFCRQLRLNYSLYALLCINIYKRISIIIFNKIHTNLGGGGDRCFCLFK